MKGIIIFISLLTLARIGSASTIVLNRYQDWQAGTGVSIDSNAIFGQMQLLPTAGIEADNFELGFLKPAWSVNYLNNVSFSLPGFITINSDGSFTSGIGLGIQTVPFSVSGGDGIFETLVQPLAGSGKQYGGLYLSGTLVNGTAFSSNYVALAFNNQSLLNSYLSITGTAIPGPTVLLTSATSARLRITKSNTTYTLSYCTTTPQTWLDLTQTTFVMSPNNMVAGLGNIYPIPGGSGGLANYAYFHVTPFASSGTWTSNVIDLGGIPTVPAVVSWAGQVNGQAQSLSLQTETSADGVNWSGWSAALSNPAGSPISNPLGRYLKIMATLGTSDPSQSPVLQSITIQQPDFTGNLLAPENVKITPNPVKSSPAKFEYDLGAPATAVSVEVFDSGGKKLFSASGSGNQGRNFYTWDISNQANGLYMLRVTASPSNGGDPVVVSKPFAVVK